MSKILLTKFTQNEQIEYKILRLVLLVNEMYLVDLRQGQHVWLEHY